MKKPSEKAIELVCGEDQENCECEIILEGGSNTVPGIKGQCSRKVEPDEVVETLPF